MTEIAQKRKLGEILVERGFITAEQLQQALNRDKRVGEALVEMGALSADELNWALSELLGVPYVEFSDEMVDFDVARTLPEEVLRRHLAFPVLRMGNELTITLADPTNRHAVIELEALTGAKISVAIAARETILHLLDRAFPRGESAPGRVPYAEFATTEGLAEIDVAGQGFALLVGAIREGATAVHLEPAAHDGCVRYRVEGQLVERGRVARNVLGALIARLRTLSGLRGATLPRLGTLRTRVERQDVELGLLLYPTLHGEAATVRIWRAGMEAPTLDRLGLSRPARQGLARLTKGPGLLLVSGPDPRARAALLYALAHTAAAPGKQIVTIERVVSFVVPEFAQVELPGDFPEGAATILAHPADVTVVEELSAGPTASAAVECVEQGGLVLGGIQAASNRAGLARLLDLRVPTGLLLATLRALLCVRPRGGGYQVETISMTEKLRRELLSRG